MTDKIDPAALAVILSGVEIMVEERVAPDAFADDALRVSAESLVDALDTALKTQPAVFVRNHGSPGPVGTTASRPDQAHPLG